MFRGWCQSSIIHVSMSLFWHIAFYFGVEELFCKETVKIIDTCMFLLIHCRRFLGKKSTVSSKMRPSHTWFFSYMHCSCMQRTHEKKIYKVTRTPIILGLVKVRKKYNLYQREWYYLLTEWFTVYFAVQSPKKARKISLKNKFLFCREPSLLSRKKNTCII